MQAKSWRFMFNSRWLGIQFFGQVSIQIHFAQVTHHNTAARRGEIDRVRDLSSNLPTTEVINDWQ